MKLIKTIIIFAAILVGLYFFTAKIDISDESDEVTAINTTEVAETEPISYEEPAEDAQNDIPRPAIENFYDFTADELDLENMDFVGVLQVESRDEWLKYVDSCIDRGFHYILFSTPTDVEYDVQSIMDGYPVTGIVITTITGGDKVIKAYKLSYTMSEEILRKLKNGAELTDEKQIAAYERAKAFTDSLAGMSDYEKSLAIHNYVCENLSYVKESEGEDVISCYAGLVGGKGNCQAYTDSFNLLCGLAGINSGRITGSAAGEDHSWNYIALDGKYYFTDCTFDDGVTDEDRGYGMFYFNLPYPVISINHVAKTIPEGCELADSLDNNNFYVRNGWYANTPDELARVYNNIANVSYTGEILYNTANGNKELTDIFVSNPKGYSKINTSKFSFDDYEVIKFNLS